MEKQERIDKGEREAMSFEAWLELLLQVLKNFPKIQRLRSAVSGTWLCVGREYCVESRELPYLFLENLVAVRERRLDSLFVLTVTFHFAPVLGERAHPSWSPGGEC